MRVNVPGVTRPRERIRFVYAGRTIEAAPGESIAAALVASGEPVLRRSRSGTRRSVYCGMGVCFECLVEVNGETRRACLEPAREGLEVAPHAPDEVQAREQAAAAPMPDIAADVVVVGGGPAGLAAAAVAARAGLSVVLVDERKHAGGQYYKQPAKEFAIDRERIDPQFRAGRDLIAEAQAAGVRFRSGAAIFAPGGANSLLARGPDGTYALRYRRLVLATGASERALPFPGWTLPGVMTTGAAQTLLRAEGVAPGRHVVIAGNGPLNLQLAAELTAAGVEVAALAELAPRPGIAAAGNIASMLATAPDLVRDGIGYLWRVRQAGTGILYGHVVTRAEGDGRLERATLVPVAADGAIQTQRACTIACDALCLGYGFTPAIELARTLGCREVFDERWRHFRLERDGEGRSSVPDIFVPGDGGGFGGARSALAQGRLAGAAIATDLGATLAGQDRAARDGWHADLGRQRRFQAALWALHAAPMLTTELAAPETLICRCEDVPLAAIDRLIDAGVEHIGAIKRETRLGMGRCQGRTCAPLALARITARTGRPLEPTDGFAPRTPLKPVTVGDIAAMTLSEEMPS